MRKQILAVLLFISSFWFSQSVNDYKAVLSTYKIQIHQYRQSVSASYYLEVYNLNNAGFEAFYDNESVTEDYKDVVSCIMISLRKMHF
jgi:hypothetical protein